MNHPKTDSILSVLNAHGRVVLRMNRASGFTQITITKSKGRYIVGTVPGASLVPSSLAGVTLTLESNSMFIESWRA
ncbi:polyribonucleotide nucleotidyltransferase [Klebsiella phage vB_KpnS-MUC-5.2]|nr:polyribonucleotide nucleotidyltransferase [Klebsiella phage vB_KpnS-MUC-5.2]